jgi:parallel beta-helix repeat protein
MIKSAVLFPIALVLGATIARGPGAQAAPTAIIACQPISTPGSYVLANNLFTGGTCLGITASSVTIDLAGFEITSVSGSGIVAATSTTGITVRNGSIVSPRAIGVDLSRADGSIVEGLRVQIFQQGGIDAKGIVRGNTVFGVGPGGVSGLPGTIGISASGTVTDNYVSSVTDGISADGTVRGNTAVNNHRGIIVSVGSTVTGNTATGNNGAGIVANCPANLIGNTAVNNGTNFMTIGSGCFTTDNLFF